VRDWRLGWAATHHGALKAQHNLGLLQQHVEFDLCNALQPKKRGDQDELKQDAYRPWHSGHALVQPWVV
jgi:hypothetical protein